ncbi:hypothetical protein CEK25_012173 [Fusarium fujikuroi]|nr:hypothetical protein CEK25_012173 [Fusarium fujikuroi]
MPLLQRPDLKTKAWAQFYVDLAPVVWNDAAFSSRASRHRDSRSLLGRVEESPVANSSHLTFVGRIPHHQVLMFDHWRRKDRLTAEAGVEKGA